MRIKYFSLFLTLICSLASLLCVDSAIAKDITDEVIKRTVIDEEIKSFCLENCIGNEKKGYLKSFTVDPKEDGQYSVHGKAAFQNRQVVKSPLEFVVYDHTVVVNTLGTLNPENCRLRIDNVFIDNDYRGIFTAMLQKHGDVVGKVETIPDCRSFIE